MRYGGKYALRCTKLASECFHLGKPYLYPFYPKLHALDHVFRAIRSDSSFHQKSMNPLTASCQCDEDLIGRVSRVSGRVNIRTVTKRTLQRHLISCNDVWRSADILHWGQVRLKKIHVATVMEPSGCINLHMGVEYQVEDPSFIIQTPWIWEFQETWFFQKKNR